MHGENFDRNAALVRELNAIAASRGVSSPQLALAWILSKHPYAVPIPGTRKFERLEENLGAIELKLESEIIDRLEALFPAGAIHGERYTEEGMVGIDAWLAEQRLA